MNKLVTLAVYPNPIEAHIIRGLLIDRGIDAYIYDEMSAAYVPLVVPGVRLAVRQCDLERALEVIREEKQ